MAKYYSGIDTSVGVGAETLDGMLANGSDFGVLPSKDIHCSNIFVDTKAVSYTHLTLPTICSV